MNSKFTNDIANKLKNGVQQPKAQPAVPKQQAPVVEAKYTPPVYTAPKYEPPKITPPVKDPFLEGFYEDEIKAGLFDESKLYVKPYEAPKLEEYYKAPMPQLTPFQYPETDYNALLQSVRQELNLTPPVHPPITNTEVWNHEAFLEGFNSIAPNNVPTPKNTLTSKTSDSIFRREKPAFAWQEQANNKLSETVRDEAFLEGFLGDEYEGNVWANNANSFGAGNREEIENLSRRFGFGAYLATVDRNAYGHPVYNGNMDNLNGNVDAMARIIFHEDLDPNAQIAIAYTIYNRSTNNYYGVSDIRMILENDYVRWINSADEVYWDPVTYTEENPVWTWGGDNARGRPTIDSWNHALNISLAIELNDGTLELVYPIPFAGNSDLPIQDYTQVYQFRSIGAWYEGYNPETRTYIDNTEYRIIGYEIVGNTVFFQHVYL